MKNIFWIFIFIVLAIFFRFYNLGNLPIFHDEAIYLLSSREIKITNIESWKQTFSNELQKPPFVFLLINLFMFNKDEDLTRARFITALFGMGTILIAYLLGKNLGRNKESLFILTLLSFSPFLIFYQRIFLLESFLLFMIFLEILIFYYSLIFKKWWLKLSVLIIAFMLVGIKQSFFFFLPLIIFFPLLGEKKIKFKEVINHSLLIFAGLFLGLIFFNLLVSLDTYFIIKDEFVIKKIDLTLLKNNLMATLIWSKSYLTNFGFFLTIFLLMISFILRLHSKNLRKYLLFILIIVVSTLGQALVAQHFFARYILIIFAFGLVFLGKELAYIYFKFKLLAVLSLIVLLINFLIFDRKIISGSQDSLFHPNEQWQYFSGWPSGWGVKEISQFIITKIQEKKIASLGKRMMPGNGLKFYLSPQGYEIREYDVNTPLVEIEENFIVAQIAKNEKIQNSSELIKEIVKPGNELKVILIKK